MNFNLLFPGTIDNEFRGNRIAFWAFCLLTLQVVWRSQHHLLAPDGGAQSIASIPLDRWSADAAQTIISTFALWGLLQCVMAFLHVLAIFRYRALIPLLYLLSIADLLGRAAIGVIKPPVLEGTAPGGALNLPLAALCAVMLALSLMPAKGKAG